MRYKNSEAKKHLLFDGGNYKSCNESDAIINITSLQNEEIDRAPFARLFNYSQNLSESSGRCVPCQSPVNYRVHKINYDSEKLRETLSIDLPATFIESLSIDDCNVYGGNFAVLKNDFIKSAINNLNCLRSDALSTSFLSGWRC